LPGAESTSGESGFLRVMNRKYDTIIFDLGGVLWYLDYITLLREIKIYNPEIDRNALNAFLLETVRLFNRGAMTEEMFLARYRVFLKHQELKKEEAYGVHCSLLHKGPTSAVHLLPDLKKTYWLCLLSNTDPWHVRYVDRVCPAIAQVFDWRIFSFDAYSLKPDIDIFHYMKRKTSINFSRSIFFDDSPENVEQGKKLGITSIKVDNEDMLIQCIGNELTM
jgi:FMN phosphatase YigB (HAD superfamily)